MHGTMFGYRTAGGGEGGGSVAAAAAAARAQSAAREASSNAEQLEERLDRLSLVCMAMWSLLMDKTKLTEQDLMERVKLLDLMDRQEDGKATRTIKKCPRCSRVMSPRHRRCLYCGQAELVQSAFDAL